MKLINNPYDTKKAKEYFKKAEFDVPSNQDVERIDPVALFEVVQEEDRDKQQTLINGFD